MRTILLLVFTFSTVQVFTQINSGLVTYSLTYGDSNSDDATFLALHAKAKEGAQYLKYELQFTKEEAMFKQVDVLEEDKSRYRMAKALSQTYGVYYHNLKTNEVLNIPEYQLVKKDEFIVIESPPTAWILTSDTKNIGEFNCRKATTMLKVTNDRGTFYHPVVAWYSPSLPFSTGPVGYNGLPGLILELQIRSVVYGATSIELNPKKPVKIEKPNKGKLITLEEYNKIIKERSDKFFGSFDN